MIKDAHIVTHLMRSGNLKVLEDRSTLLTIKVRCWRGAQETGVEQLNVTDIFLNKRT